MTTSDDNVIAKLKALAASWADETNWPVTDNGGDFCAPTITVEGYRVSVYAGPFGGWDWEIMPGDGRAPLSSDWLTRDTAAEAKGIDWTWWVERMDAPGLVSTGGFGFQTASEARRDVLAEFWSDLWDGRTAHEQWRRVHAQRPLVERPVIIASRAQWAAEVRKQHIGFRYARDRMLRRGLGPRHGQKAHSGTYETHQRPPTVYGGGGKRGTTIVRRIADGSRTAPYYR